MPSGGGSVGVGVGVGSGGVGFGVFVGLGVGGSPGLGVPFGGGLPSGGFGVGTGSPIGGGVGVGASVQSSGAIKPPQSMRPNRCEVADPCGPRRLVPRRARSIQSASASSQRSGAPSSCSTLETFTYQEPHMWV